MIEEFLKKFEICRRISELTKRKRWILGFLEAELEKMRLGFVRPLALAYRSRKIVLDRPCMRTLAGPPVPHCAIAPYHVNLGILVRLVTLFQ